MADAELEEVSYSPSRCLLLASGSDRETDQASSPCAAPAAGWLERRLGTKSGWEPGRAAEVSISAAKDVKDEADRLSKTS